MYLVIYHLDEWQPKSEGNMLQSFRDLSSDCVNSFSLVCPSQVA